MNEYLTTREVADLLRIKERKIYDLAASGEIPCTRATGKLLFGRDAINNWLNRHSHHPDIIAEQLPAVFLGSHDPLLEWALRQSQCGIATFFDGSGDGLERFARREGLAAGLHLFHAERNTWNTPFVQQRFSAFPVVLIEWAVRRRGLIVSERLRDKVSGIGDLRGLTIAPRQSDSGTQSLSAHLLEKAALSESDIAFAEPSRTEFDAALAVADGKADATLGLESVARQFRLPFIKLVEERFDILFCRREWFEAPLQKFVGFCRSPAFATRAAEMRGYDVSGFGTIHFNGV